MHVLLFPSPSCLLKPCSLVRVGVWVWGSWTRGELSGEVVCQGSNMNYCLLPGDGGGRSAGDGVSILYFACALSLSLSLALTLCHILLFVVYLQLQDPECLTSSSTPIEQAACFMAHSLGYVVLSLAHTASSVRLSGQVSSHSEQRPRLIRASQRHFFPALHWMSSHDLASGVEKGGGRGETSLIR